MNKELPFLIYDTPHENIKVDVMVISKMETTTRNGTIPNMISDFDRAIKQLSEGENGSV